MLFPDLPVRSASTPGFSVRSIVLHRHKQVITPGGKPDIDGKIYFKHRAIGMVTLDDDQNTILVKVIVVRPLKYRA